MIKISMSELKSHPGKYVSMAAGENTVYITKRGRPIAKLVSAAPDIMSLVGILPRTRTLLRRARSA